MKEKACKECGLITDSNVCSVCKNPTSNDWIGLITIIDPEKSQMAKYLKLKSKGRYALRVR